MNQLSKFALAMAVVVGSAVTAVASESNTENGAGGEYTIRMSRPARVGQRLYFRGDGLTERTVSATTGRSEREVESSRLSVTLVATATVNAVDENDRPTRVSYAVDECSMMRGNKQTTLAPKGATLVAAARNGVTSFEVNGRPLSGQATEALTIIAALHQGPIVNENVFGSMSPRAIGESWAVNVEPALDEIEMRTGQKLSASQVSGVSTLASVERHHGHPCLLVHSQLFADKVVPSMHDLPAGMQVKSASFMAVYQGVYPNDERLPSFGSSVRYDTDAVLTRSGRAGANQPETRMHSVCVVDIETTPVSALSATTGANPDAEAEAVAEAEAGFVDGDQD